MPEKTQVFLPEHNALTLEPELFNSRHNPAEAVRRSLPPASEDAPMPFRLIPGRYFWFLLVAAVFGSGCSEQEVKRIERVTGKAWDKVRQGGAVVGAELGLDLDNWQESWKHLTLPRLIEQRLRQDAALRGADIRVQIQGEEIVLSGTVMEDAQRQRAVQLTQSVQGVSRVRDALRLANDAP